jgi:hypothetical protein
VQRTTIGPEDYARVVDEGWYEVRFDRFSLDFYFRPSEVKAAFVFSPGWLNRAEHPYPYFQRITWFRELDGVGISLADPTQKLSADVQVGWFVGTYATDYLAITAGFVAGLLAHLGVPPSRTLFFGSSAGGFASLGFSTYVRGTKALAVNPQTELLRFHDVAELAATLRVGFRGMDQIRIRTLCPWRVSIAALWAREGYVPAATVLVNTHDRWHMEHHVAPLLDAVTGVDVPSGMRIELFSSVEAGHNPPPASRLVPMMRALTAAGA